MRGAVFGLLCSGAAFLLCAPGAFGADANLPQGSQVPVLRAPAPIPPSPICSDIASFFSSNCQASWDGVRIYGIVDMGFGYQTHGAPWDPNFTQGASYLIQKMNRAPTWGPAPSGLSQSNLGIQIKEPFSSGWAFIGQLEGGFDPYSLRFANSPHSEFENIGVPVNQQTANGDSARAGQFYNSVGFLGVSSERFGALTVFRQNSLTLDGILAYDPMAGAYAFSPVGFNGAFAGGGDTEDAKYSTSVKYRFTYGGFRAAALWQFGGYELNNASRGSWEGEVGGDFANLGPGILSLDAFFDYTRDAVALSLAGAPTNVEGYPIGTMLPQTLTATLSDNTAVMVAAKYAVDRLKLYAGYEWMQFAPPSDPFTIPGTGFTDISGDFICFDCNTAVGGTNISSTAYNASTGFKDKILQLGWFGARYSVTDTVDLVGAYYHYGQNQFASSTANVQACAIASTNKSFCAGSISAYSVVVDWTFAPKWDTYIGTMFSQVDGGLANGYLARNNLATTAGIRFRF